ncbi:MAG: RNA-binding cell elongation regulator Jag/EloR [Clostridia bacterium]|nr:RNA-binding cell elongation regulator Jag/EloR [Clostridia bacterium]
MRSMEFSGKTLDEAIFHGLNEMGVSIDEVEVITVQTESKGIFGLGARNAVVRLVEREVKAKPVFETPVKKREGEGRRSSFDKPKRDGAPRRERERDDREKAAVEYPYTKECAENSESARFLQELISKMGIDAEVTACETEQGLRLNILSNGDGVLIGRRGETLDAIQHLVSIYANRGRRDEAYQRITVDTENYRARREQQLCSLARKNAARVAKTGRPFALNPMTAYERRVVHAALAEFRGVETHSEGVEPMRRVVITPNR